MPVDMVAHMKTTIEIADALLEEAKKVAAREQTTVRALVEDGLRRALAERKKKSGFRLKLVTAGGSGLARDVPADLPRHLAYDEGPEGKP
jgi:Arc/MetJ family transcription regulator